MGIEQDVAMFEAKLNAAIDIAMQTDVLDIAKIEISNAVDKEVYKNYDPTMYQRRKFSKGGLADVNVINKVSYDPVNRILEVRDDSVDGKTGRLVAPVVESGKGYTWKNSNIYAMQPFPRPFHKIAEHNLKVSGEFEKALEISLISQGFEAKKQGI